jgi:hypothetical protein
MRPAALIKWLCVTCGCLLVITGALWISYRPHSKSLPRRLVYGRPELREAMTTLQTPGQGHDNYGNEVQIAWRLNAVLEESEYKFRPEDRPGFKLLFEDRTASVYARLCAAYFLIDTDMAARAFVTQKLSSTDMHERYNAARVIQWFAETTPEGEPRHWAADELIKLIENRGLEGAPPDTMFVPEGEDWNSPPFEYICRTLGKLKDPRALPALMALNDRDMNNSSDPLYAIGNIGDIAAGPYLLHKLEERKQSSIVAAQLGHLKYRPAIPALMEEIRAAKAFSDAQPYVQALVSMGSPGDEAIAEVEKLVANLASDKEQRLATRMLVQLKGGDPVGRLLQMYQEEKDQNEQIDLIWRLRDYQDLRVTHFLSQLARNSPVEILRKQAIWGLGAVKTRPALLELASLLDVPFPTDLKRDKFDILEGTPSIALRKQIVFSLKMATDQDFETDSTKWRDWISQHVSQ